MRGHQPDGLLVARQRVLDAVDARLDGPFDVVRVSVDCDAEAELVCLVDGRRDLVARVIAGDLDEVGPALTFSRTGARKSSGPFASRTSPCLTGGAPSVLPSAPWPPVAVISRPGRNLSDRPTVYP